MWPQPQEDVCRPRQKTWSQGQPPGEPVVHGAGRMWKPGLQKAEQAGAADSLHPVVNIKFAVDIIGVLFDGAWGNG